MQRLSNFCKMRHHIRSHFRVLTNNHAWTYRQTRSYVAAVNKKTVEPRRPLFTLNPEKLSSPYQFPRDISGILDVSYIVQTRNTFLGGITIRYTTSERRYLPFPANTRGFLYYKAPEPESPDYSGSLRFRVVSEESGSNLNFADGFDLKLPTGGIWKIHLYSALRTVRHAGLVYKLVEEGLVSPLVIEKLRALPFVLLQSTSQILHRLEDPFVARLHGVESLVFMSEKDVQSGQIMPMFQDCRKSINKHPYRGTVVARFERSTLAEHADTRTIVLRVLEELSPIQCVIKDYDSHVSMPTPGSLLYGKYKKGAESSLRPWSTNLDNGKGKATKMISLLWPSLSGR